MTAKEYVNQTVQSLDESQLAEVADYLAYLRFRKRTRGMPSFDTSQIASLYAEAAGEDRNLAEAGMADYAKALAREDSA